MKHSHQRWRRRAAVLLGIVFLISGLLKLADPVGTMLIVTEYAKFFHVSFIIPAARVLGILLGLLESVLGVILITGVLRKVAAISASVLLGLFTLVTIILWIANPNMDCGCFGQAIHLSHAQSFFKNVFLLALAAFAFLPWKEFGAPKRRKWVASALAVVALLYAVLYSNTHLPIVDYTDFNWGAELFASLDDDVELDNHYQTAYVYEKNGRQGTFFLSQLPDSTWTFVRADSLFVLGPARKNGHPILSFRNAEGEYCDSLAANGKVVVFSVYDPAKAPWERLQKQYQAVEAVGGRPLLMVATSPDAVDTFGIPIDLTVYYADFKTLISLNRSNGGGAHFDDGELVHKWPTNDFPENIDYELNIVDPVEQSSYMISRRHIKAEGFVLYLAALLILL